MRNGECANHILQGVTEEEGIPDAEEEEEVIERYEDTIQETLFTFDAFEMVGTETDLGNMASNEGAYPEICKRGNKPNTSDVSSSIQRIWLS